MVWYLDEFEFSGPHLHQLWWTIESRAARFMYKASLTYHSMDPSLANAFEMIRKAQYDQMNAEIERAYAEHRWKAQQLFQEAHASLAAQLQVRLDPLIRLHLLLEVLQA